MKRFLSLILTLTLAWLPLHAADLSPSQVDDLLRPYFQLQEALAKDELNGAHRAAKSLLQAAEDLEGQSADTIREQSEDIVDTDKIARARQAFEPLSNEMIRLVKGTGTNSENEVYLMFCPMAMGGMGANWLQNNDTLVNPYYGAEMLHCGVKKGNIARR
ncbi:MAG: Cu(I)/Ag(I) efflux system membrane protein CusB [Puniceicoccaceae bacterium 5H]|nr:MAG: Cu(I)/Ag(I) efflux system membrane protein CusB [Puniceicoccaceae bacterium 5H]